MAMAFALVAAVACSDEGSDPGAPTGPTPPPALTLSQTSVTIIRSLGETATVDATFNGAAAPVTYESAHPSIATVDASGLITPVSDGQTFVIARLQSDPTVNSTVVVNVISTVVSVAPTAPFTWVGGPARQITATVENNTNTNVTWSSSNPAVATVSATGEVTPVSAGTAQIIATSEADPTKQAAAALTVDVAPPAQFVELTSGTPVTVSAATGESKYYRITVPEGATRLVVQTAGDNGDSDIYLRPGAPPTASQWICRPWLAGSTESCPVDNPQSRIYYIWIDAYEGYSNVTLTATVTP